MIHLRAHNASRVSDCPGSLQFQYAGKATKTDNPSMKFGREMHSLTEEVLKGEVLLEEIEDDDHRAWVERCLNFIMTTIVGTSLGQEPWKDGRVDSEVPLFVLGQRGEHIASCRADAVCWRDEKTLIIPDWKFYRDPLDFQEHQLQLLVMCVAALQTYKADVAQGILYLPIVDMTYNLDLTRELLPEAEIQLEEIWKDANADKPVLQSGKWCARCPCLVRCPTALESISKIEREVDLAKYTQMSLDDLPTVQAQTVGILNRIHKLSPARVRRLVELYPLLAPLQDAIRAKLREDLERDATSHVGWELKERRSKAKGEIKALRSVAGDFNISAEEFEKKCVSVSVAKVRDLLAAKLKEVNADVPKIVIIQQVMEALEPLIEQEMQTILQRRKG